MPNIILFSWDGFQRNHSLELLKNGSLPNLQQFIDDGVFLNLTVTDYMTQTKPGHAQMLTGYRGRITGVYSNEVFFHPIPDGYTLLERVEAHFDDVVTCMITGKKKNLEVDTIAKLEEAEYCEQGIFSNVPEDIDITRVSEDPPEKVGPRMIQFIRKYKDSHFVAFFHFDEPDRQGHEYGENSRQYDEAAKSCDYWFGKILNKLREANIAHRTLIYVVTDHGFHEDEFHHKYDSDIWMATNDLMLKVNDNETRCDMIDVAPTIYHALGIDKTDFNTSLEGYPLQKKLPSEADERYSSYDDDDPRINLEYTRRKNRLRVYITDESRFTAYLLIDNSLIEVIKSDVEIIKKIKLGYGNHSIEIMVFDKRENLERKTCIVDGQIIEIKIMAFTRDFLFAFTHPYSSPITSPV